MTKALQALLTNVIDYAGMFPPAKLSLKESLANYLQYKKSTESWMLGSFICPATKVRDFCEQIDWSAITPKHHLSLTSAANLDDSQQLTDLQSHLELANSLAKPHISISLEIKLPQQPIANFMEYATPFCDKIYLEVPFDAPFDKETLQQKVGLKPNSKWAFKFRTGGIVPEAFPSSEQLARAIIACRDAGIAWKATAGLHHPLRHFDEKIGTKMHGFMNVIGAAVLCQISHLTELQVCQILEEESPEAFLFQEETFRWRDFEASATEIEQARKQTMQSFGSCSFDDPCDDLRECKLI